MALPLTFQSQIPHATLFRFRRFRFRFRMPQFCQIPQIPQIPLQIPRATVLPDSADSAQSVSDSADSACHGFARFRRFRRFRYTPRATQKVNCRLRPTVSTVLLSRDASSHQAARLQRAVPQHPAVLSINVEWHKVKQVKHVKQVFWHKVKHVKQLQYARDKMGIR